MGWIPYVTMTLLMLCGMLLIFIILLQRGRGGGLAGALGGMGGQSAFGTKAGDVFTRITVGLAIIWVVLAAGNVYALRLSGTRFKGGSEAVPTAPALKESGLGGGLEGLGDEGDQPSETPAKGDGATPSASEPKAGDAPAGEAPKESKPEATETPEPAKTPDEPAADAPTEKPAAEASTNETSGSDSKPGE